jgi:hypothetical protein
VSAPVIRIADPADGPALAALRRAWTAERHGPAGDEGFEARFLDWYDREFARRSCWLAEVDGAAVGLVHLAVSARTTASSSGTGSRDARRQTSALYSAGGPSWGPMTGSNAAE